MSASQSVWRPLPTKNLIVNELLLLVQSSKQPKPSAETDVEMALRGWFGPNCGPERRWP